MPIRTNKPSKLIRELHILFSENQIVELFKIIIFMSVIIRKSD